MSTGTTYSKEGEPPRPGARFLKAFRQLVESVNQILNAQLDLDRHGGHTAEGVVTRVLHRHIALTAAPQFDRCPTITAGCRSFACSWLTTTGDPSELLELSVWHRSRTFASVRTRKLYA
jgi:hypothetical protein